MERILLNVVASVAVVGGTRPFGRDHRGTERMVRRALSAECRALGGLLVPLQDLPRDAELRFFGDDVPHVETLGRVVGRELGAQTEATLRLLLDRYVSRPSDQLRSAAMETYRQGDAAAAVRMLREARASDPENHRIQLDYAGINLELGDITEAETVLDALPRDIREEAEAVRLYALLGFPVRRLAARPPR